MQDSKASNGTEDGVQDNRTTKDDGECPDVEVEVKSKAKPKATKMKKPTSRCTHVPLKASPGSWWTPV